MLLVNGKAAADRYDRATEYLRLALNPFLARRGAALRPVAAEGHQPAQFVDVTDAELANYDAIYWCDVGQFGTGDLRRIERICAAAAGSSSRWATGRPRTWRRTTACCSGTATASCRRSWRRRSPPRPSTISTSPLPRGTTRTRTGRSRRSPTRRTATPCDTPGSISTCRARWRPRGASAPSCRSCPRRSRSRRTSWTSRCRSATRPSSSGTRRSARTARRCRCGRGTAAGSAVPARYRGKVILFNSTFNMDWTTWPGSPSFGAMMQELARLAVSGRLREQATAVGGVLEEFLPGGSAELDATVNFPGLSQQRQAGPHPHPARRGRQRLPLARDRLQRRLPRRDRRHRPGNPVRRQRAGHDTGPARQRERPGPAGRAQAARAVFRLGPPACQGPDDRGPQERPGQCRAQEVRVPIGPDIARYALLLVLLLDLRRGGPRLEVRPLHGRRRRDPRRRRPG